MIKKLIVSVGLASALIFSTILSVGATNMVPSCSGDCIISRNSCNAACGGNAECQAICQSEYECCLLACHGQSCRKSK